MIYHTPVLLKESIEGLKIRESGIYVDATYGGGGHSAELLKFLGAEGRIVAFDQDPDAIKNKIEDDRVIMINQNFRYIRNFLKLFRLEPVDGILADLGVSSYQIDNPSKGFSTRFEGELDFRMNPNRSLTAAKVINEYPVTKLTRIFSSYGELRNARQIAVGIENARLSKPFENTAEFRELLIPLAKKGQEYKFLAQVFQAVRIEVNDEMEALKDLLFQSAGLLRKGGRLVIITYHSLEDRLAKNFIKAGNPEGEVKKDFYGNPECPYHPVNRKPVVPSDDEIRRNNRARSAKLRIAEKLFDNE